MALTGTLVLQPLPHLVLESITVTQFWSIQYAERARVCDVRYVQPYLGVTTPFSPRP